MVPLSFKTDLLSRPSKPIQGDHRDTKSRGLGSLEFVIAMFLGYLLVSYHNNEHGY